MSPSGAAGEALAALLSSGVGVAGFSCGEAGDRFAHVQFSPPSISVSRV